MKKAYLISILMVICSLSGCMHMVLDPTEGEEDGLWVIDDEGGQSGNWEGDEACLGEGGSENVSTSECPGDAENLEHEINNQTQEEPEEVQEVSGPINVPPCSTIASEGLNQTSNPSEWPEIRNGQWLAIDGLTNVSYSSIEIGNESDVVVDYRLDWMCGYTYSVKIPGGYNASNQYPVFLYLHGQLEDSVFFNNMLTNNFHVPEDDKYIIVRPSKLEVDWDPKKALDVLEDVKSHLSVDDDRVYLTGLSMGGRGTFIVAAALPDYFAAIMPLSPHHEPYSYIPLAKDVAHLPIWMSHGTADNTSSYEMAEQMAENLSDLGAEIEFHPVLDGGHYIWFPIYSDPSVMQWMLSHVRGQ